MRKKRILLCSAQKLFGESLEQTLCRVAEVELVGHWLVDDNLVENLDSVSPDLIIVTDESLVAEDLSRLTARILDRYPDVPVFRVTLERNQMQIYSSHLAPASSRDLIDLIHGLSIE